MADDEQAGTPDSAGASKPSWLTRTAGHVAKRSGDRGIDRMADTVLNAGAAWLRDSGGVRRFSGASAPGKLKTPLTFGNIVVFEQSAGTGGGKRGEYRVTVTTPTQSHTFGIGETRWHIEVDEETSRRLPTWARNAGVVLIPFTGGLSAALFALRHERVTGTVTVTMSAGAGTAAVSFTEQIQVRNLAKVVEHQQNVAKLVILAQEAQQAAH